MSTAIIALFIMQIARSVFKGKMNDGMLIITLPTSDYRSKKVKVFEILEEQISNGRIDSISENDDVTVISYNFKKLEKEELLKLQSMLRNVVNLAKTNVYFNRSGEI